MSKNIAAPFLETGFHCLASYRVVAASLICIIASTASTYTAMQTLPIGASSCLQPCADPGLLPMQLPRQPASIAKHDKQSQEDMLSSKPAEQPSVNSMWWECSTSAVSDIQLAAIRVTEASTVCILVGELVNMHMYMVYVHVIKLQWQQVYSRIMANTKLWLCHAHVNSNVSC